MQHRVSFVNSNDVGVDEPDATTKRTMKRVGRGLVVHGMEIDASVGHVARYGQEDGTVSHLLVVMNV